MIPSAVVWFSRIGKMQKKPILKTRIRFYAPESSIVSYFYLYFFRRLNGLIEIGMAISVEHAIQNVDALVFIADLVRVPNDGAGIGAAFLSQHL